MKAILIFSVLTSYDIRDPQRSASIFAEAAAHRASKSGEDDGALFQYGPRTGCKSFKVQMAKFLSDGYNDTVREENLGEKEMT